MDTLLKLTQALILLATALFILVYLPRLRCWLRPLHRQKHLLNEKKARIAVVIPARNESRAIPPLFDSLSRQDYPAGCFDTFVVVADPADPTVALTEAFGGTAYAVPEQQRKGDALDGAFKRILASFPGRYDAFLIIDADCVLSPDYLSEMNNALASGAKVISGRKVVKNYLSAAKDANSIWSACNGLIWQIIDDLGNRFKSDRGVTIMTIGTGLMLTADLITEAGGWPYRETLTEDIELMYDCMYRDIPTYYTSYAKLYMEESTSLSVTDKRRTRWLTGVVDSKRLYASRIRSRCRTAKGLLNYYYTTALCPVYWFIGFLSVLFCLNVGLSALLVLTGSSLAVPAFAVAAECFLIVYGAFFLLTAACLLAGRRDIRLSLFKKLMVLLVHPVFYMGYIPIIARALFTGANRGWEVIDRVDFGTEGGNADDKAAGTAGNR